MPDDAPPPPRIGLALGGGGARGIAHLHVLQALDDLGLRPAHVAGSSIGALIGAGCASGMRAREITAHVLDALATPRIAAGRLWHSRPASLAEFLADGGLRIGQLNAERLVTAFLPARVPSRIEDMPIRLSVMATSFFEGEELSIETGDTASAVGASIAIPSLFRPVRRGGRVLVDGGIANPLPFDVVARTCDFVIACDVTGGPEPGAAPMPTPLEAMIGASQIMMSAVIRAKLTSGAPDIFLQPPVSRYRVLDFLRARTILAETEPLREEARDRVAAAFAERGWPLGRPSPEEVARFVV
jgi:NTE family protein